MDQATLIRNVVKQVVEQLNNGGSTPATHSHQNQMPTGNSPSTQPDKPAKAAPYSTGRYGIFDDVNAAVAAAHKAWQQLNQHGLEARGTICTMIQDIALKNAQHWGRIELDETEVGRLDHKIAKLELLQKVPGVEFLTTHAHSGDDGIGLDEAASWGVIGCITPVTHSIPTLSANAINMIAAGNAMIINPHPSAAQCAAEAVRAYNQAIAEKFGIEHLITIIVPPTIESAQAIFEHEDVALLVVTGGPAVAQAAMAQRKRAIVAGPGNPPVVVDETANLKRAAESIIAGGGFDNNLLCIGEKQVFVVESVMQPFQQALRDAGAVELNASQLDRLTQAAFTKKPNGYMAVNKELVGKDCCVLAEAAGSGCGPRDVVPLLFGTTDANHAFVQQEQMMPFLPIVPVRSFEQAMDHALQSEHGFGHTGVIHSNNFDRITVMGRTMNTTLFIVNGPSTAGLGIGGEGYATYSIATPTGEGITTPLTFTRFRRMSISGSMRMI